MREVQKSEYDLMREADEKEEDAFFPGEWAEEKNKTKTDKERYFEYYDDIKTNIKEDW